MSVVPRPFVLGSELFKFFIHYLVIRFADGQNKELIDFTHLSLGSPEMGAPEGWTISKYTRR